MGMDIALYKKKKKRENKQTKKPPHSFLFLTSQVCPTPKRGARRGVTNTAALMALAADAVAAPSTATETVTSLERRRRTGWSGGASARSAVSKGRTGASNGATRGVVARTLPLSVWEFN